MSRTNDLTSRQQKFCIEYAKGKSGAQAYLDAGYDPKNRDNASKYAYDLLQKDKIDREWRRLVKLRSGRTQARKDTAIAKALGFVLNHLPKLNKIVRDIVSGEELTDEQKMFYSSFKSIIANLSRDDTANIDIDVEAGSAAAANSEAIDHEQAEAFLEGIQQAREAGSDPEGTQDRSEDSSE